MSMRAVVATRPGGVEVLEIVERPRPSIGPCQLLVRNFAAALNRADILQRRGLYPPPAGASDVLGLEFAGEVAAVGSDVRGFRRGDRVFGLVPGGACADFLAVDFREVLPIGDRLSFEAAAAIPEAFAAAWEGLFALGRLAAGECTLILAGASGVGTAAIQLARARGARAIATASTPTKLDRCRELGAFRAISYRDEAVAEAVVDATDGRGVEVVLDLVGASRVRDTLRSLALGGRWVLMGLLGGGRAEVDLGVVLSKRIELRATTLRHRFGPERIALRDRLEAEILPLVDSRTVQPVIDRVYPLEEVRDAHERMEANQNVGKIVLRL